MQIRGTNHINVFYASKQLILLDPVVFQQLVPWPPTPPPIPITHSFYSCLQNVHIDYCIRHFSEVAIQRDVNSINIRLYCHWTAFKKLISFLRTIHVGSDGLHKTRNKFHNSTRFLQNDKNIFKDFQEALNPDLADTITCLISISTRCKFFQYHHIFYTNATFFFVFIHSLPCGGLRRAWTVFSLFLNTHPPVLIVMVYGTGLLPPPHEQISPNIEIKVPFNWLHPVDQHFGIDNI